MWQISFKSVLLLKRATNQTSILTITFYNIEVRYLLPLNEPVDLIMATGLAIGGSGGGGSMELLKYGFGLLDRLCTWKWKIWLIRTSISRSLEDIMCEHLEGPIQQWTSFRL